MTTPTITRPDSLAADAAEIFGAPIYVYTRAEAIADGFQVEVPTNLSREAGLKFPVYMTREAWAATVEVPKGCDGWQDETGRLWDVLNMTRFSARRAAGAEMKVVVHVIQNSRQRRPRPVLLKATVGPVDFDNPAPAITLMMPDQD